MSIHTIYNSTLRSTCHFFTKDAQFDPKDPKNKTLVAWVQSFIAAAEVDRERQQQAVAIQKEYRTVQNRIDEYKAAKAEQATDPMGHQPEIVHTTDEAELIEEIAAHEKLHNDWVNLAQEMAQANEALVLSRQELAMHMNAYQKLQATQHNVRVNALSACLSDLVTDLADSLNLDMATPPQWLENLQNSADTLEAEMNQQPELSFRPVVPTPTMPINEPDQVNERTQEEALKKRLEYLEKHAMKQVPQEQLDRFVATNNKTFQGAFNFYFSAGKSHAANELALVKICRHGMAETLRLQQRCEIIYGKGCEIEEQIKPQISTAPTPKPNLIKRLDEALQLQAEPKNTPVNQPDTAPKPTITRG